MHLEFDSEDLRPLIVAVVNEALAADAATKARLGNGRLAYPEAEAAATIGSAKHVLRDARLRGEIVGLKIGNRIYYEATELRDFLARQRLD